MYFALGFLVAGLIALLCAPAFWRRAMRLSMRRLQMLAPMSMEEVIAERDLLRAEFAVRERRMEQEIEAVKTSRAFDLAAIGRHAARIAEAETRIKKAEADNRDMAVALSGAQKALAERTDLLRSTELALMEMTERADRDVARLRLLETDKQALGREKEMQYSRVLAHEAKIGALHEQAAALGQELDELKRAHEHAATEAARVPGLAKTLAHRSEELDLARREAQRLATELEDARKAAAAELERRRNEIESLENALRLARSEARDAADRLEAARADKAMLHGAVETLRAERAHQRRNNGVEMVSEPPSQADVAALRSALADFGTRVAELAEPAPERVE